MRTARTLSLAACTLIFTLIGCRAARGTAQTDAPSATRDAERTLVFVEYIAAPQEAVWDALTQPGRTPDYFHGTKLTIEGLEPGSAIQHLSADGERVVIDGKVRSAQAPRDLEYGFSFPEYDDAPTTVRYHLEAAGEGTTKLTIEHTGFAANTKTFRRVFDGWPPVLSGLKTLLESGSPLEVPSFQTKASKDRPANPRHRFVRYIRTTPEALWIALTDPDWTPRYFHGFALSAPPHDGETFEYLAKDASPKIHGTVTSIAPREHLEFEFLPAGSEGRSSMVRFTIDDLGAGVCRLTVQHDFEVEDQTFGRVAHGWPPVLSGLKTLLETGSSLPVALH